MFSVIMFLCFMVKTWTVILAVTGAALAAMLASFGYAKEVTFNYGTDRQLRVCTDLTKPSSGPISVAQATAYVACSYEKKPPVKAYVNFMDVKRLEIASTTRKVLTGDIVLWPQIDQRKPIYVLRGHVVTHTCWNIAGIYKNGANCTRYDRPNAKGSCYIDKFADWHCSLGGLAATETRNQPAPS